ncbi:hypothetical protein T265_07993 [Opisthorchis viverrini]|uniref:Uncharacterized protein n=1 Tax=Opisthorchis viverrini TaxID=6198 RepID=A0A074ZF99_OPIVI|nr:hypothetical protein T265_07993 [Opisthorchis viverrini]KER24307.1 hypothetical protein T265_07993 [Opisthorchis viverrini]
MGPSEIRNGPLAHQDMVISVFVLAHVSQPIWLRRIAETTEQLAKPNTKKRDSDQRFVAVSTDKKFAGVIREEHLPGWRQESTFESQVI